LKRKARPEASPKYLFYLNSLFMKIDLTLLEKENLKKNKLKIKNLNNFSIDEIEKVLNITEMRAKEIKALIEFQKISSIGIKFAHDLISLGYYSIEELKDKNGYDLFRNLEKLCGTSIDPCVEDQFRLVIYNANNLNSNKKWWDFTNERKKYRLLIGGQ